MLATAESRRAKRLAQRRVVRLQQALADDLLLRISAQEEHRCSRYRSARQAPNTGPLITGMRTWTTAAGYGKYRYDMQC